MNLQNIKTEAEFNQFADNWYQRVHRLREVWQNPLETRKRKEKAFVLWRIMFHRTMKLFQMALVMSQPKRKPDAPDAPSGMAMGKEGNILEILNNLNRKR
jgi:hypothetical protein